MNEYLQKLASSLQGNLTESENVKEHIINRAFSTLPKNIKDITIEQFEDPKINSMYWNVKLGKQKTPSIMIFRKNNKIITAIKGIM